MDAAGDKPNDSNRESELDLCPMSQGAEARLFRCTLLNKPAVLKRRFVKTYRHPDLDSRLSAQRLRNEVRLMQRCRQVGVRTPTLLHVDIVRREIFMEEIRPSLMVKDYLNWLLAKGNSDGASSIEASLQRLASALGSMIGTLHVNDIVHGDLTTSNMLLFGESAQSIYAEQSLNIVVIDFGLAYQHRLSEDKAVDLFVLERALLSTHPNTEFLFSDIMRAYRASNMKGSPDVISKLNAVRQRGRKMVMIG